jgi:hypothetical protein
MILCGIDGVDTDHVCKELFEVGNVPSAGGAVGERIGVGTVFGLGAVGLVILLVGNPFEEAVYELSEESVVD